MEICLLLTILVSWRLLLTVSCLEQRMFLCWIACLLVFVCLSVCLFLKLFLQCFFGDLRFDLVES